MLNSNDSNNISPGTKKPQDALKAGMETGQEGAAVGGSRVAPSCCLVKQTAREQAGLGPMEPGEGSKCIPGVQGEGHNGHSCWFPQHPSPLKYQFPLTSPSVLPKILLLQISTGVNPTQTCLFPSFMWPWTHAQNATNTVI